MKFFKKEFAIIVPAHNEEKVIKDTITSLLNLTSKENIFIANDGSTDDTGKIARSFNVKVLDIHLNKGKASAINSTIDYFKLAKNYQYIMPLDADTLIDPNFLKYTLEKFKEDSNIVCVVGKVVSQKVSPMTFYRLWEYEITQSIHKSAQDKIGAIVVCPGCATIYKSEVFEKVKVPTGTLTEDMDLTFLIHRLNLGRITFEERSKVYTQDPNTPTEFVKQIDRWYTGFWQCLVKHKIPWGGQMVDLEVAVLALEGIFSGLISLAFIFLAPILIVLHPKVILFGIAVDLLFMIIPTLTLTGIRHKSIKVFFFIPLYYLIRFISSLIFLKSFLKVVLGVDLSMGWNKVKRYKGGETWLNPSLR